MAENVRVVVRCRPMNKREHALKCSNILEINDCTLSIRNPNDEQAPAKRFTYDVVYDDLAPTEAIYNDVCYSLVESALEGYNATIFAYGQTGCGKTHTMQGPEVINGSSEEGVNLSQRGIISRTFEQIFEGISVAKDERYLVLISYLEIYNESIRDLLSNDLSVSHVLKELPGVGVVVPTLSTHLVHNAKECYDLLNLGNKQRALGATLMNNQSSRSHTIFTVSLEQIHNSDVDHISSPTAIKRGKLNLVDLAGSERQNKTGAAGERLREATKINLSLSALGNVISALVDGKTKHIPYRDSKLTRLLQDSLGGNTKTLMIACVSPADNNYDETISTLRYAARAKNIANKPKINEDAKDAKLREYQAEIAQLKELLKQNSSIQKQQKEEPKELVEPAEKLQQEEPSVVQIQPNINLQLEAQERIDQIKRALIGGERASDEKLREKRQRRKMAAERRLSALAQALSRVVESEDRDLLQVHYTSISQELQMKNDYLKRSRQKIKLLEQEVNDLQAEFQLDRADYLDTIRRLERQLKFYQQIMEHALPILRKAGKYWDLEQILQNSNWNDDLKTWKLPETTLNSLKLPLTARAVTTAKDGKQQQQQLQIATSSSISNRHKTGINRRNYFDEAVLSATQAFTTRSAEKYINKSSESDDLKTTTTITDRNLNDLNNQALGDFVARWKEAYKSKKIL